ncbi:PREDICTED: chloride channel protein 2-like [Amphimedon queenslandica]|uniref:Chloride channel protein n=1 Tax=Amphimedon queenslandica TaxID=400682 RepID=A0AAN0JWI9_AMPQE|nr:PREDICTED: chloride channel protein 2-like [Amphimedon queenslandica]|eukprot:XP_019861546.1 PREDICTED: chloride channel protein 2-like [Amphimedon queenslandica]
MAGQTETQEYEFERTLMHGRYRSELGGFAREIAASQRERDAQRMKMASVAKHQRRELRKRSFNIFKTYIAPYVGDWLFILMLGLLMAVLSFIIDYLIQILGEAHQVLSLKLIADSHWFLKAFLWVVFPLILILFSVGFVQLVSVHAIGSGIPEMKTVLRGVNLPNYLSFRTFISKTVTLITAAGSTLPIGKEGPFVHISSIIAEIMSRIIGKYVKIFNHIFANEAHTNELLAAACAVGVSSNFAAPIGGVLFSIEVTATYFAVRNYWRGFFGAVSGAFLFRLIAVWVKQEETITALFKTSFDIVFPFDPLEIMAFAFIGVLLFTYQLTQKTALEQLFSNFTWWRIRDDRFDLPDDSIQRQVLDQWGNTSIFASLTLFILFKFVFTTIAVALPIPAGVFFPVFIIGAAFGRVVGELMDFAFVNGINGRLISPGGYAVVGAAAMAGGVTHTISTSVIVFELTGQITHILPVMIAVLISVAVASLIQPSFYDSIILLKELPFLPDIKLHKYYDLYARDIMRKNVLYITYQSTYRDIRQLLRTSKQYSFPLVDSEESRILIGSVSRNNLHKLVDAQLEGVYEHAKEIKQRERENEEDPLRASPERPSSPRLSVVVQSMSEGFNRIFKFGDEADGDDNTNEDLTYIIRSESESSEFLLRLEEQQLSQRAEFPSTMIDPSPFQLVEMTSLTKVHSLFSLLTLSHAYVTSLGKLVGVVTLTDLSDAIEGKKGSIKTKYNDTDEEEQHDRYELETVAASEHTTEIDATIM